MRTRSLFHPLAVVSVAVAALGTACDSTKPDTTPAEVSITSGDTLRSLGATAALTATVRNASHEPLAGVPVTDWQSSDPSVLTVNSSTGVATAVTNGSATVTVHSGTLIGSALVVVRQRVTTVTVSGSTVIGSLGSSVQLAASSADALGVAITGRTVQWSTSNIAVASIEAASGLAVATGPGTVTLRATVEGTVGTLDLTVAQVPASITLTAPTDTLRSLTATGQYTAVVKDSGGSTIAVPAVQWTSSNTAVVTITSAQGVATAVSNGSLYVRAQAGTILDSVRLVVRQRVDVTKSFLGVGRAMLFIDDTVRATLQARDALNVPIAFGGATVSFSGMGGSGSSTMTFLPTVDRGAGAYTSDFFGAGIGTNSIVTAMIDGAPIPVTPTVRVVGFTKIAAGGFSITDAQGTTTGGHSCGILTTGEMYCWGMSLFGIRGNGTPGTGGADPIPTLVGGNQQWADVGTGLAFVCALATGGAAYCWGDGDVGQIGNGLSGNPPDVRTPTAVSGGNAFASLSIGVTQGACALTAANAAMCWGEGSFGRLGNGGENLSAVPVPVSGGLSFAAIATSFAGTCGVAAGSAYCWGHYYVLGGGGAPAPDTCTGGNPCAKTPVAVSGGHVFRPIMSRDANVACAVSTDDKTYCWGTGYLGNGTQSLTTVPVVVNGGLTFTSLASGDAAYCGTVAGGAAYCWGDNRNGRLGNNSTAAALDPVAVSGGHAFTQLSLSQDHACGISTDGNAWCWGGNDKGELGTRTVVPSLVPVRVKLFVP